MCDRRLRQGGRHRLRTAQQCLSQSTTSQTLGSGVAAELQLKCSGRRNMLGSIIGKRRCSWFAPTSALMAHVFRSNTNLQLNYRLPITAETHDCDCKRYHLESLFCSVTYNRQCQLFFEFLRQDALLFVVSRGR